MYRVISEKHGLVWTSGEDDTYEDAEYIALITAVNTARTVYLQKGTSN